MNKGLIIREIYALKGQLKALFFIIAVFTVVAVWSGNDGMVLYVNTLLLVTGMMINLNTVAEDEKCGWDMYGLTLPVKRTEVIGVRYLVLLIFAVVAALYMAALNALVYLIHGLGGMDGMLSSVMLLALIVLVQIILLPVAVKSGAAKARLYMMVILGIPFMVIALLAQMVEERVWRSWIPSDQVLQQLVGIAKFAVPVTLVLVMVISYYIAVSIYRKKEF